MQRDEILVRLRERIVAFAASRMGRDVAEDLAQEMLERLTAATQRLGERCRQIFRLKLLGRTFPEIQEELGAASVNTVYTWDARCRQRLLELMGGRWEKK